MLPPDLTDGIPEWEIEEILASRKRRGKLEYHIQWKGYDTSERTWEPAANLKHSQELVEEFHKAHPKAIRSIAGIYHVDSHTFSSFLENRLLSELES